MYDIPERADVRKCIITEETIRSGRLPAPADQDRGRQGRRRDELRGLARRPGRHRLEPDGPRRQPAAHADRATPKLASHGSAPSATSGDPPRSQLVPPLGPQISARMLRAARSRFEFPTLINPRDPGPAQISAGSDSTAPHRPIPDRLGWPSTRPLAEPVAGPHSGPLTRRALPGVISDRNQVAAMWSGGVAQPRARRPRDATGNIRASDAGRPGEGAVARRGDSGITRRRRPPAGVHAETLTDDARREPTASRRAFARPPRPRRCPS